MVVACKVKKTSCKVPENLTVGKGILTAEPALIRLLGRKTIFEKVNKRTEENTPLPHLPGDSKNKEQQATTNPRSNEVRNHNSRPWRIRGPANGQNFGPPWFDGRKGS